MARINKIMKNPIFNNEGVRATHINPLAQLERSVMSCLLWENEFYEDGISISKRLVDLCAIVSAEELADAAIRAKEEMRLRHVPLLLARELLRKKEGRQAFSCVADKIFTRPDDIAEFLAIYWKDNPNEPLAKQAKKWIGHAFRKFDEYQLQKYNGDKKAIKLRDAMRITRPKPVDAAQAELWRKLVKNELATPDTWEVALSSGGNKKEIWTRLLTENKLGGLAMLRNIRNMREAGVADNLIRGGIRGINAGRLMPINFISAATHNPQFENEIELKFFECFTKEKFAGKTIILVDISPSMAAKLSARSEVSRMDVGFSLAMIAREMFADILIYSFSNQRVQVANRRGFALKDAINNSQVSNGTLLGNALKDLPEHDRLIVITDEESQDKIPQMPGYMINVASGKNGIGYGTWTHIDGWSDKVLNYITQLEAM